MPVMNFRPLSDWCWAVRKKKSKTGSQNERIYILQKRKQILSPFFLLYLHRFLKLELQLRSQSASLPNSKISKYLADTDSFQLQPKKPHFTSTPVLNWDQNCPKENKNTMECELEEHKNYPNPPPQLSKMAILNSLGQHFIFTLQYSRGISETPD